MPILENWFNLELDMQNQSGKIVLVLVLLLLLIGAAVYFFLPGLKNQEYTEPISDLSVQASPNNKTDFVSKEMDFSIKNNANLVVKEYANSIDLYSGNEKINISRIATNFLELKEYLNDFDSKRKLKIEGEKVLEIGNLNVIERFELFEVGPIKEQKIIYILTKDGWVYTISSSSKSLYPFLDQIVQSFEYKP